MPKKSRRMRKLEKHSYKEKYENYRARIDSESYHELTPEQEKQGEENRKRLDEFIKKRREQEEKEKNQKAEK